MTLQEYLDQSDPQKQSIGSVLLESSDYQVLTAFGRFPRQQEILIYELASTTYIVDMSSGSVYTSDADGNKNKPTVFKLNN